jgi:hypothetical protein
MEMAGVARDPLIRIIFCVYLIQHAKQSTEQHESRRQLELSSLALDFQICDHNEDGGQPRRVYRRQVLSSATWDAR